MSPTVDITRLNFNRDTTLRVRDAMEFLASAEVLVGIPQAVNSRKGKLGNATLMYIHTNGSPLRGIPARPVIQPAIEADGNRQVISDELKAAAVARLQGHPQESIQDLRRAGQAGVNVSKAWFTDPRNNWAPNRPSTIRRKKSDRPLIDTGTLRRSITYVVRERQ